MPPSIRLLLLHYLFTLILSSLLVYLSLFCTIDGILLVQLEHLHFLLDGLHGGSWSGVSPED